MQASYPTRIIIDAFHVEYDELLEVAHSAQDAQALQQAATELDETPKAGDLLLETEKLGPWMCRQKPLSYAGH